MGRPEQKDRQIEFIVLTVFSIRLACSTTGLFHKKYLKGHGGLSAGGGG
jgi:hypothetical protein